MKFHNFLASSLALPILLIVAPAIAQDDSLPAANGDHVDANGMPATHSTPAEHATTADLNNQVSGVNAQADATSNQNNAQYQAQQQQYQNQQQQYENQLQQNQAAQQQFQNQTAAYEDLRARYAAERTAYHRAVWPEHYSRLTLDESEGNLIGQRVEIVNGDRIGTVTDVAHSPNGRVEALRVALDNDAVVWIDKADVRYDRADGIVMTNLDHNDLHQMAEERM